MWRTIDQKLRSPEFTVTLICIIGLASVVGTVPVEVFRTWKGGELLSGLLEAVGADHLFRTWWYTSLLVFLAFLMIYCSLRRLPSIIRVFTSLPDPTAWPHGDRSTSYSFTVSKVSREAVRERVVRALRGRGYRVRTISDEQEKGAAVFDKGRAGILGPPLVHLGLVIALVGGLVTQRFGSVQEITLGEGEVFSFPSGSQQVKLEKFSIIHHPGTREPEEYVSSLMVTGKDGERRWHALRVNRPLSLPGATLYQVRYRPEFRYVSLAAFEPESRDSLGTATLVLGEKTELPGQDLAVKLEEILPDFAVDSENNVFTRSPYFLNPAVKISVYSPAQSETPVWTGWAFKGMFPSHDSSKSPLLFVIQRLSLKYYSGIKLVNDPGALVAYLGFVFLVAGSFLSCYSFRRFVRVEFENDELDEGTHVIISGHSLKNRPDFLYEWKGLVREVGESAHG